MGVGAHTAHYKSYCSSRAYALHTRTTIVSADVKTGRSIVTVSYKLWIHMMGDIDDGCIDV